MSALIRDLRVANRDCSGLDLIFLKFISSLLFCCSRIAICVSITFQALEGKKAVKMYLNFFLWFCALGVVSSAVAPLILLTWFLSLPVSGVIINIHEVTCYVSLSLPVVCGNFLSCLQIFIRINLVSVTYCRYFCRCGQITGNSRIYKNNKDK